MLFKSKVTWFPLISLNSTMRVLNSVIDGLVVPRDYKGKPKSDQGEVQVCEGEGEEGLKLVRVANTLLLWCRIPISINVGEGGGDGGYYRKEIVYLQTGLKEFSSNPLRGNEINHPHIFSYMTF
jgi:hypothetical protein